MWSSSVSYDGEIIIECPDGPEGDSIRDEEDDVWIRDEAEGRSAIIPGDAHDLQHPEETRDKLPLEFLEEISTLGPT